MQITEEAKQRIRAIQSQNPGSFLKISITEGGCAGLKYELSIGKLEEGEIIIEDDGEALVVTEQSSEGFISECMIDFRRALMKGGFVIKNQNNSVSCSCGSSFRARPHIGSAKED